MLEHIWEFVMYVEPDGSYTEDKNTAEGDDNGAYILKYSDGFWTVVAFSRAAEGKRATEITP